ncbi:hypothetical protein H8K90_05945 [Winogradskyella echinorum]|uniref:Gliding motility-associated protein GldM C-terminal domain-containing protein n=1 Tax=Winogradskyella echinorum TaxID=538189 RepID=A0ABR6XZJ4_9FLAO|nr:GldM family protein [Winogradskyella echinorum]MBC3845912.1 hypothetical protein [Winogradskyella echinorum]MBC5750260.1 hypothetical protein [Winogradskyella echinorum]
MKQFILLIFMLSLIMSCKSSQSKTQLITENQALKERIKKLEAVDTVNKEVALEVKKMNVVYRGVANPIYISKPNALSFEATAPGLVKKDNKGNYVLSARSGNSVDIKIKSVLKNGDSLTETKTLRIKDIGKLNGTINGLGFGNKCEIRLTKEELKKATIGVKVNDFLFDWNFVVAEFKVAYNEEIILDNDGFKFTDSSKQVIKELKVNDLIIIFDIKVFISGINTYRTKNPAPITVRIIE